MPLTAIIISSLALGLSAFTFYWLNIREKKNFYLLRIDRMTVSDEPEFALVNGGSKDILIITIECAFENKDKNGSTYPAQQIEYCESESLLLQAGKSIHCKVHFREPFTSTFALEGELSDRSKSPIYQRELRVDVAWVDTNGESYNASAVIFKYGFKESGEICTRSPLPSPLKKKHDLYKSH